MRNLSLAGVLLLASAAPSRAGSSLSAAPNEAQQALQAAQQQLTAMQAAKQASQARAIRLTTYGFTRSDSTILPDIDFYTLEGEWDGVPYALQLIFDERTQDCSVELKQLIIRSRFFSLRPATRIRVGMRLAADGTLREVGYGFSGRNSPASVYKFLQRYASSGTLDWQRLTSEPLVAAESRRQEERIQQVLLVLPPIIDRLRDKGYAPTPKYNDVPPKGARSLSELAGAAYFLEKTLTTGLKIELFINGIDESLQPSGAGQVKFADGRPIRFDSPEELLAKTDDLRSLP